MTKRQVLYVMGTPMLADFFHENRWDYIYQIKKSGEDVEKKAISIFFENDKIKGIQGDLKPSALPVVKPSTEQMVDVPPRDLEKTLWEIMTGWVDYDGIDVDKPKPSALSQ
jgi:outer membrane protein assembly factor BamE